MDDQLALLAYCAKTNVPSEYVIFEREEAGNAAGRYLNYETIIADAHKPRKTKTLSELVLKYTQPQYERIATLFPLFALWFHYRTDPATGDPTDPARDAAYEAVKEHTAYAQQSHINEAETSKIYAERIIAPYIGRRAAKLREDREVYAQIRTKESLRDIIVSDRLLDLAHDLELESATSTFAVPTHPSLEQVFETLPVDELVPFVVHIFRQPDGSIGSRYRAHTSTAQEQLSQWIDAMRKKVDLARETADKDTKPEVIAFVMYRRILTAHLEASATPDEEVDEEEVENADAEEEQEQEEEEELRSVAVERRSPAERERLFTTLSYDGEMFSIEIPDDIIDIKSRSIVEEFIFDRLKAPHDTETKLVSVKGTFVVFEFAFVPELLLHLIATDRRFSPFFYILEVQKSFAEKDRLTIHYEPTAGRHVMISFSKLEFAKKTKDFRKRGQIVGYNGRRYFEISLSLATDHAIVEEVRSMLLRLFEIYSQREEELADLYALFFPDLPRLETPVLETREAPLSAFEEAKLIAPNLFRRQGRAYQTGSQVRVITLQRLLHPTEEDYAKDPEGTEERRIAAQERFDEFKDRVDPKTGAKREILLYKGVYYTSELPGKPYMAFKKTTSTKGVPVPSCSAKKTLEISPVTYEAIQKPKKKKSAKEEQKAAAAARTGKPIQTQKILKPGYPGAVVSSLGTLLSHYIGLDKLYIRYGVPYTANALLHCVCTAMQDPLYLKAENRDLYVLNIRRTQLIRYAHAARQEMYDTPTGELVKLLESTIWLDPRRYYRIVEEWMNAREEELHKADPEHRKKMAHPYRIFLLETTDERGMNVIIPRHRLFHIRDYHEAATVVLLYLHTGQECNSATHEQVELIASRTRVKRAPKTGFIFDSLPLAEKLQTMMLHSHVVYRIEAIEHHGSTAQSVLTRSHDLPSATYLFEPLRILSQQTDSYGKLRAVRLSTRGDPTVSIVVLTPPLAPLGTDGGHLVREEKLLGIRSPVNRVVELLGRLKHISRNRQSASPFFSTVEQGNTRALHFYVGTLPDACNVLVEPVPFDGAEPVSGIPCFDPRGPSVLEKLQRLRKALTEVLRHVELTYAEALDHNQRPTGKEHIANVCELVKDFNYTDPAVAYGRAILDSERMRLWLEEYVDAFLARGQRLPPSILMRTPPAAPIGTAVTYVPSAEMLDEWEDYIIFDTPVVHESIDFALLTRMYQPYYLSYEGKLFCLQMVRRNDRDTALICAYNWIVYHANTGFYTRLPEGTDEHVAMQYTNMEMISIGNSTVERHNYATQDGKDLSAIRFTYDRVVDKEKTTEEYWGALMYVGEMTEQVPQ